MTMAQFDVTAARSKFPALNQDQVYFDNAGGSQTLGTVVDSICQYLTNNNVQLGATYRVGKLATARYNDGFASAAKYVNAQEDEIAFGSSTTQLYRNLSYALEFQEGDEIVISSIDHEANIAPWVDLAARNKLTLKWWTPAKSTNPKLLPSDLEGLLTPKTRLVTCTHASNILGTITDVKAVAATVHAAVPGALVCVDGVAYAPHRPLDLADLGVDVYCFSWYKVYGPHISMMYARQATAQQPHNMRSLGHFFKGGATLDEKLGLAGASYELLQAVPHAVEYLGGTAGGWPALVAHEHALQKTLLDYLASKPDVFTVIGETTADPAARVPTVSFLVKGWNAQALVETVEKATAFGFRWGAFYSNRLAYDLLGLEPDGVVRISMVHYNTVEEVKGIIAAIEKAILQ
ncbi:cysteine desulfurase protein [Apiospora marii]|uniref:Cysteine desulfurase protein n=1 Tax=Apiospora marii TaxID=335849 RepID=A0ABR1S7H6_9PEZI